MVPAEFRYASDTNTDWLSGDDLNKMMASV